MQIDAFGAVLAQNGIQSGSGVPCSYFTSLVNYMEASRELDYLPATSEGEAVAIAAGLVTAGKPAFALMQNSGLGNAVNPITSMLYIYSMPVALLISHRGEPGGKPDEPQHELMGQITGELSRLCGLETHLLEDGSFGAQLASALTRGVPAAWIVKDGTIEGGPKAKPRPMAFTSGAIELPPRVRFEPVLGREDALRRLLPIMNGTKPALKPAGGWRAGQGASEASEDRGSPTSHPPAERPAPLRMAIISTTGKLSRELFELDDRQHDKANRFYMVGSMGCAAGFGLGIARAQPERKVLILDGDGAVLMKLGTLATIGSLQPKNLHHVVFDNGVHDTTGGQRTASPSVDLATVALACGYQKAATVADPEQLEHAVGEHLASDGPTFLRVLIKPGSRADLGRPTLKPRACYERFSLFLRGGR